MRKALRIARLIACWALLVVGVLGTLLFALVLIFGDTQGARGGAILLIAISLALVGGGVFGLRRRPKPPEEPVPSAAPAAEPLSRAAAQAHDRLRRGETIVLLPRRRRWALILVGSAVFCAGSVWWFIETSSCSRRPASCSSAPARRSRSRSSCPAGRTCGSRPTVS